MSSPTASTTDGEHTDRGWGAIEVVAAVVGHRDGGDAGVDGASGVVDAAYALEQERAVPLVAEPCDVLPGGRWALHPLAVGAEEGGGLAVGGGQVGGGQVRHVSRRWRTPEATGWADVRRELRAWS